MKKESLPALLSCLLVFSILFLSCPDVYGQSNQNISLQDLTSFDNPADNWKISGKAVASLDEPNQISTTNGEGILVNDPEGHQARDLFTGFQHGDIDLELDFMMAKNSNSGIYLQGRYELQLLDSWDVKNPTSGDNGGIYERWDENRPQGSKGFEGHPPRQNASRAPGVWQHLEISFQAPRFDSNGNKIKNARIIRAVLNGVTIHEDLELTGPTRGAVGNNEVEQGPLRFQGDHGAIAFRNINITHYNRQPPSLGNIEYNIFEGAFNEEPDFDTLSAIETGESEVLTANLGPMPEQFLVRYRGTINNPQPGEYNFNLNVSGGAGLLRLDGETVIDIADNEGAMQLSEGSHTFELLYSRSSDWGDPHLELSVTAEGLRRQLLSDQQNYWGGNKTIYVKASEKPLLRSFRDLPGGTRLTHAVSVSSLDNVHYTYDLNHGNLVQVWRGNFLNATPMWYNRGDGSSRPEGTVEHLIRKPSLAVNRLEDVNKSWSSDTTGTGFKSKGYKLDKKDQPTFTYKIFGSEINDKIRVANGGKGISRTITFSKVPEDVYIRLAEGESIQKGEGNRYLIDDQSYYIFLDDKTESQPEVRTAGSRQELIIPAQSIIQYTILF